MQVFKNKQEIFSYLKRKLSGENKVIIVKGSTAYGAIKAFSDIDVEVYGEKMNKPYYELIFLREKPVLVSVYFNRYQEGEPIKPKSNMRVIYGKYNNNLIPDSANEKYNPEQGVRRECQMVVDALFKYIRHKDKKDLERVQKRI